AEFHDAVANPVAATFIQHRALQHGVEVLAIGADSQTLEASVGAFAGCVRFRVSSGKVRRASITWDQVGRSGERSNTNPIVIKLVQIWAILVRHIKMFVLRIDDETFRVERNAKNVCGTRILSIEGSIMLIPIPEDNGLENFETGDRAGVLIDIQTKTLHAGFVVDKTSARPTIAEAPPRTRLPVVENV